MATMTAWDLQAELARSIYHGAVQNVVRAIVADRHPNRMLNATDVFAIADTIETNTRYGINDEDRAHMATDVRKVAESMAEAQYETVMFDADSINDPNHEGVTSGFMSRLAAIRQFELNSIIMAAHNGGITERGTNDDGLPYAKFADGSALETFKVYL